MATGDPGDERQPATDPTVDHLRKRQAPPLVPPAPPVSAPATRPFTCPVCGGRRAVPLGYYNVGTTGFAGGTSVPATEPCRSCGGTGVVWQP